MRKFLLLLLPIFITSSCSHNSNISEEKASVQPTVTTAEPLETTESATDASIMPSETPDLPVVTSDAGKPDEMTKLGKYENDSLFIEIFEDGNYKVIYKGITYVSKYQTSPTVFTCWANENYCEGLVYVEGSTIYDSNHRPFDIYFTLSENFDTLKITTSVIFPKEELIRIK